MKTIPMTTFWSLIASATGYSAWWPPSLLQGLELLLALCAFATLLVSAWSYFVWERSNGSSRLHAKGKPLDGLIRLTKQVAGRNERNNNKDMVPIEQVRLLTLNMLLRPPFINYNGNDYKNERLQILIRDVLPHYDIVALQELFWFWNTRLSTIIKEAKKLGFNWYCTSLSPPFLCKKFVDGGLIILSKYPIVETQSRIFSKGVQIDGWTAKQALHAKINITPTTHIHVLTTHTQADYASNVSNEKTASARMSQIEEMGEMVNEIIKNDPQRAPVIILGDLNVDGRSHDDVNRKNNKHKWGEWGEEDEESEEYKLMMRTFSNAVEGSVVTTAMGKSKEVKQQSSGTFCVKIKDLVQEAYNGIHPVTIGDVIVDDQTGDLIAKDKVLTDPVTDMYSRACLDYIISFKPSAEPEVLRSEKVKLNVSESRVEPFYLDPKKVGIPCGQLSDHYGLSTSLTVYAHQ